MKRVRVCHLLPGIIGLFLLGLTACSDSERQTQSRGFHLPNGDFELGKEIFVEFKCHQCHTVAGVALPEDGFTLTPPVEIGGTVRKVRSYGELVTSIIDPDHTVPTAYRNTNPEADPKKETGPSPMPAFNEEMTVQQLVDLAAFLFSTYQEHDVFDVDYYIIMP